jgi:penicillin-binding protein 2
LDPSGKVIKQITPKVVSKLSASKQTLNYLRSALAETTVSGTAAWVFPGFPLDQIPIAAKTGTGQVSNKDSTSWLATFAPANNPRYTVVMMVSQGGTGSGTSGPSVRKIYEAIFGVTGNTVSPANSVFVGGAPSAALPKVDTNGSPILLEGATTGVQK